MKLLRLHDPRVPALRMLAAHRWKANQEPGDWHFNIHHQRYQFSLPGDGTFFAPDAYLVEMRPSDFELGLLRLRVARHLVLAAALQDPNTRELFSHG